MNRPLPETQIPSGELPPVYLPLRPVQRLGNRTMRDGLYLGLIAALIGHSAAIGGPQYTMWQMRLAVTKMNRELKEYFKRTLDVDVVEEKPEKDETPPPQPELPVEPEPIAKEEPQPQQKEEEQPEQKKDDPYEEEEEDDNADAAEAQDVLTANDDAVDLTDGNTFVDKDGSNSTGTGKSSVKGKRDGHVDDKHVKPGGKGKGKSGGKGPRKTNPEPKKNLSRAANVKGGGWSCPWPPQADLYQVDHAAVTLAIVVGADGKARSANVVSDPGYGFGSAARRCAMGRQYLPALNADGDPISQSIQVRVTFRR